MGVSIYKRKTGRIQPLPFPERVLFSLRYTFGFEIHSFVLDFIHHKDLYDFEIYLEYMNADNAVESYEVMFHDINPSLGGEFKVIAYANTTPLDKAFLREFHNSVYRVAALTVREIL